LRRDLLKAEGWGFAWVILQHCGIWMGKKREPRPALTNRYPGISLRGKGAKLPSWLEWGCDTGPDKEVFLGSFLGICS
jgi:hypothetical protein